jgi:glycerol-3-phosphate dehydrogenase
MKPRDFDGALSNACDLLVIGGTCQGLAVAREAALNGLRTTLIEPLDFGFDASSYHLQIIPGGLHFLRRGRIGLARRAVNARRRLARIAPWSIRPIPFLATTASGAPGSRLVWQGIFKVDGWLGRRRNEGVEPELHLPPARLVSTTATLRLFPGVRREGISGGIQWYDYQILDSHRFAIALAAGAEAAGAELLNHVEVLDVLRDGGRVVGARVRDAITGAEADARARVVIYAAHQDRGDLIRKFGISPSPAKLRHLTATTSKPASDMALTTSTDGRRLVLMPSKGRALIGLTEPIESHAEGPSTESALAGFIARANESFPALGVSTADVTSFEETIDADAQSAMAVHESGVILLRTSNAAAALDAASAAVRTTAKRIERAIRATRSASTLPGAGIADHEALLIESARKFGIDVPPHVMRHLLPRYAEASATIVGLIASNPTLMQPLVEDLPHLAAEVVHAVRYEKAVRLDDILLRRLGVSDASSRAPKVRQAAGALAAQELGWDQSRYNAEVQPANRKAGTVTAS